MLIVESEKIITNKYKYTSYQCITSGKNMFAKHVKVGPKGQIVIPKVFRDEFEIYPGSEVIIEYTGEGIVINNDLEETEEIFEDVAKTGKKVKRKIDPEEAYESQMEERN